MSLRNWNSRRTMTAGAFSLLAIVALSWNWMAWSADTREKPKRKNDVLSQKMRLKLAASSKVLEGLAIEDADLIREGANAMAEQSQAEFWQVLTDADYREFTQDFRRSMRRLKESADKENFDSAALDWLDAVKCCLDCHKHVRNVKVNLKK